MNSNPTIVTGATGSIGLATSRALARQGKPVLMACRNTQRANELRSEILKQLPDAQIDILYLDLEDFSSIVNFVDILKQNNIHPVALHNNAGILCRRFERTSLGFERTLAVNYIGTYLLTRLLDGQLADKAVIVNTISLSRLVADVDDHLFDTDEHSFKQVKAYAQSKVALELFTIELAKHTKHIVVATDPGVVNSKIIHMDRWFDPLADLLFRPLCKTPEQGAKPALNALQATESGFYYHGNRRQQFQKKYINHPYIKWLWDTTEQKLNGLGFTF